MIFISPSKALRNKQKEILDLNFVIAFQQHHANLVRIKFAAMNNHAVSANKYFSLQQHLCCNYLAGYAIQKDEEDLHQLRVALKKIKAILLMLRHLHKDFNYEKNYAPYKKLFKQTGPMRQTLLQASRLKNAGLSNGVNSDYVALISRSVKQLIKSTPVHLKAIEKIAPAIKNELQRLAPENIYPYCKRLCKQLKRKWRGAEKDDKLHDFRKYLKQLLYCAKLLTPHQVRTLLPKTYYNRLNKMQDLIGSWHDNLLLTNEIETGRLKASDEFMQSLNRETKSLKKKIINLGNKV